MKTMRLRETVRSDIQTSSPFISPEQLTEGNTCIKTYECTSTPWEYYRLFDFRNKSRDVDINLNPPYVCYVAVTDHVDYFIDTLL